MSRTRPYSFARMSSCTFAPQVNSRFEYLKAMRSRCSSRHGAGTESCQSLISVLPKQYWPTATGHSGTCWWSPAAMTEPLKTSAWLRRGNERQSPWQKGPPNIQLKLQQKISNRCPRGADSLWRYCVSATRGRTQYRGQVQSTPSAGLPSRTGSGYLVNKGGSVLLVSRNWPLLSALANLGRPKRSLHPMQLFSQAPSARATTQSCAVRSACWA